MAQIYHMNEATICSLQKQEKVICKAVSERARDKSVVRDEMAVPAAEIVQCLTSGSIFQRPRRGRSPQGDGRVVPSLLPGRVRGVGGRSSALPIAGSAKGEAGPQSGTSSASSFRLSGLEMRYDPGRWAWKDLPQAPAQPRRVQKEEPATCCLIAR